MSAQAITQSFEKVGLVILPQMNLRKFWIPGFILIICLAAFYIFQISQITSGGFSMSQYEQRIRQLSQDNKTLEAGLSLVNYSANLENVLEGLGYEKVERVYYIRALDGTAFVK